MSIIWKHKNLVGLTVEKEKTFKYPVSPTQVEKGLKLRVFPSGQKSWLFERMANGKRYKKTLGQFPIFTIVEAVQATADANRTIQFGEDPFPKAVEPEPEPESTRMTVAEGWARYVEDMVRRGNKSVHERDQLGQKDIVEPLGFKFLSDVTTDDVRKIIQRPIERCKTKKATLSPTGGVVTSNHVLRTCKTFFKFCFDSGYDDMQRNPATAIRVVTNIVGKKRKRVLSVREMALLIMAGREFDRRRAVAKKLDGRKGGLTTWGDIFSVLVLTGNRKSEVYGAFGHEWDSANKVWRIGAERYKTNVDAVLPVGPSVATIFDRRATSDGYIFPSQTGVRTGQDRHICDQITEIMEEIGGEPIERWSMHSTRYGFRSGIRKAKIADSELAEKIIHPKTADDLVEYDPDWFDEMREALKAWDSLIRKEMGAIDFGRLRRVA
ncbi:integrase family protein [Qipengyuania citrea]|uniref:tyrosine-type recombinase/integrase n=1 Tax=Qipengyuania citrea TaxID=225971 RepID=UPI001E3BC4CB|nr:integrase family protein [Qipengyuania citrea]MCD1589802.1 integrase family protein [Qipengyuania citrea]